MLYVGLDVHWKTSSVCILDQNGRQVKTETVRGGWEKLKKWFRKELTKPFAVCYEASCGYGHLHDFLRPLAARVVVAHPGQLRLIFRSKRKNDRLDAQRLAKLLYLDEVPAVYVPSIQVRDWRQMIEGRRRLVAKRTRSKNGLRSLLRGHGIAPPRKEFKNLWSKKGRMWLASAALPTAWACIQRDLLMDELDQYDRQVALVTGELDRIVATHPGVALLRSIPGVGPRTAEAVVAYIDDPQRFSRVRQIGAYFGLVPCQDASASKNHLGHITKDGPASVRKLLIEASWQVIRHCAEARALFDRIHGGKKDRRKVALVAVAHWLSRCMLAMLRTGEWWRYAA